MRCSDEAGIGKLCPRYTRIPLAISLCRYGFDINQYIGFWGVSRGATLKNYNNDATYNDYGCLLIDTGGMTARLKY